MLPTHKILNSVVATPCYKKNHNYFLSNNRHTSWYYHDSDETKVERQSDHVMSVLENEVVALGLQVKMLEAEYLDSQKYRTAFETSKKYNELWSAYQKHGITWTLSKKRKGYRAAEIIKNEFLEYYLEGVQIPNLLRFKACHEGGKLHGPATNFDQFQNVTSRLSFKNGELDGQCVYCIGREIITIHFKNGTIDGEIQVHELGRLHKNADPEKGRLILQGNAKINYFTDSLIAHVGGKFLLADFQQGNLHGTAYLFERKPTMDVYTATITTYDKGQCSGAVYSGKLLNAYLSNVRNMDFEHIKTNIEKSSFIELWVTWFSRNQLQGNVYCFEDRLDFLVFTPEHALSPLLIGELKEDIHSVTPVYLTQFYQWTGERLVTKLYAGQLLAMCTEMPIVDRQSYTEFHGQLTHEYNDFVNKLTHIPQYPQFSQSWDGLAALANFCQVE